MRDAYRAALADRDLLQEAAKANIDMALRPPDELIALIEKLYATSPQTLEAARRLLPGGG
jgi:hypothetical protein